MLALAAEGSEAESPDVVYDYSPYGERTSESLEGTAAAALSPFGFTGAYQFQDGTVHLNHRFHSTFTMGFTQPDPSRQELNNYAYAQCDPINLMDPTGLVSCTEQAIAGLVVAGLFLLSTFFIASTGGAALFFITGAATLWGATFYQRGGCPPAGRLL
ncbi:RHS repeat-associated core domain-containing protein [Nocardiopsis synnemataformans]|uniref:RHS repeat-associated core domain-containing protein n=1 Tax=Nocardiopsis synnemataformans TaxID=61305 RepID=UPI003EB6EC5A